MTTSHQFDDDFRFRDWMKKVDAEIERRVGCSSDDLADFCYRDAYEQGESPKRVAACAIKADHG